VVTDLFNRLGSLGVLLIASALIIGGLAGAAVAHHYETLPTQSAASHQQQGSTQAQQGEHDAQAGASGEQGEHSDKPDPKTIKKPKATTSPAPTKAKPTPSTPPKPKASPKPSPETN
jgi:cytoskeletal protein RodZ